MYYIAQDVDGNLVDHTMSEHRLTTLLASFQLQIKQARTYAKSAGRNDPLATDYPEFKLREVSVEQYRRARDKDLAHFKRLLVEN